MNENISHNFFIWEEKNSTEPQKNYENKNASETKDTTNDIQTNVENLHWKDITNPKLREKMRKKEWYDAHKDKLRVKYKNYYEDNKEKIIIKSKAYAKDNKDKIFSYKKAYREVNKEKLKIVKKAYYKTNKNKIKAYLEANKDKIKLINKAYYEVNKDKRKAYYDSNKDKIKAYYEVNKDKINSHRNNRLKTDIQFKLKSSLRSRLNSAINNNYKAGSAVRDLGCTIPELKTYLESKFQPGMSWDNWTTDGWHIDHIKPLASFDLTDRNQLLEACNYTNLQPLWAKDNLIKSDSVSNL